MGKLRRVQPAAVIDRFATVEPKVMLAIAGYRYGEADRQPPRVAEVRAALPALEHLVHVPTSAARTTRFERSVGAAAAESGARFDPMPFDHPPTCSSHPGRPSRRKRSSTATGHLVEHL
jgi:acetoacetyl-CoA synthetase